MATLYFKVSSDYQEVIRLRQECEKLEAQLKKMDVTKSPAAARALETQLASAKQQMMGLVTEAAKAGAVMEHDFKNGIYNASQTVNNLSANITSQRGVIRQLQNELTLLKEKYRETVKSGGDTTGMSEQIKAQTAKLREQKDILFSLTQQQAEARLSVKRLKDEYAAFKEEAGETVEANEKMSVSLTKVLGVIGGVTALKNFVTELVNVRGQFQQLEIAFTTMLKSEEKADRLMSELVDIAAKTPFDLQGVASSAKQMLAYGSSAENVGEELVMLGNVAAGVGSQLSEIAYLYGTLRTQGRAYAVDIRQFAGRGIPIYEELAKVLGVTKDEVSGLVTAGKVGFKEVEQAFKNMTGASGIYYNLMEEQSKSLTGQLSNLGDAWDTMLNEIGKDTQGIASAGISATKGLIENYETVGKVLIGVIATYGTYKTATLALWAIEQARAKTLWASISATKTLTMAQAALNTVMKANPYVLLATALIGVVSAMWAFHDSATEAEKAQDRLNKKQEEAHKIAEEHKQKIDELINSSRDLALSDLQRGQSLAELRKEYPKIFAQYDIESIKLADILKLKQQIAEEDAQRAGKQQKKEFTDLENEIKYYENLLKSLPGQQGVDGYVKKLKELRAERDILLQKRGKGISEQFISSLKNIDISEFDRYIAELERRIKGKGDNGKIKMRLPIDVKGSLSDEALFDVKDIKTLIDTTKSTRNARIESAKQQTTYQEDLAKAKADWETAKKGYEALIKDQKATSEQVKKTKEEMEAKEKAYKELGGITGSSLTRQDNKAQKEAERQKKEQQRLYDELLQLRFKNQQDEINLMAEGAEKKRRQIELDYQKRMDEIGKQERSLKEAQKGTLTGEQEAELQRSRELADEARKQALNDSYLAELQYMQDYLKEYGTFQQQKLAIAQEYDRKIAQAGNEWQRKSLEAQKASDLQQVEINALKQNIDWGSVFGDFGMMFKEQLQPTIDELKAIARSDDFKSSSLQDQQALYELIAKLEQSNAAWDSDIFKQVSDDMNAYQSAMQGYVEAQNRETVATKALAEAKEHLAKVERSGDAQAILDARSRVQEAQTMLGDAAKEVKAFGTQVQQTTSDLQTSSQRAVDMFQGLEAGLQGLASGNLQGIGQGIMQLDKLFGGDLTKEAGNTLARGFQSLLGEDSKASKVLTEALGSSGMAGEIISAVLGILDLLSQGLGSITSSLIDTVWGAVNGVLSDALSGDILLKPLKSVRNGLYGLVDTLTFGKFDSWFGIGGNAEEVQKSIDRLTDRNEALQTSIDDLNDTIKASRGTQSVSAAQQAVQYQKEQNANYLRIAREQARYSGAHHSWNYYWKGFSQDQIGRLSEQIGRSWNGDIWSLSPEEMKVLRSNVDMWTQIQDTGKGGYGERLTEKLDDYIDQAGKLEDITNSLYEGLTGISFDSMYDSFIDTLMNMDASAQDAADDIAEYFMRAMLSNKIGEMYYDKLEGWWKKFGQAMEDGDLSKDERENLQNDYMGYIEEALKLRDELAAATGYDKIGNTQQTATGKGYATASQDSIDELSGRTTAMYESNLRIEAAEQQQTVAITELRGSIGALTAQASGLYNIADETRTILANSYLELQQIREHTEDSAKYLKDIKADIAEVKRNTAKL